MNKIVWMLVFRLYHLGNDRVFNRKRDSYGAEFWLAIPARDSGTWLPATVPGTVHTDLLANGKIEDPFYRMNELRLQWIDKKDWEYRTEFIVSEEIGKKVNQRITFTGVDTYADVYLNGEKLGNTDNMFRTWRFDG